MTRAQRVVVVWMAGALAAAVVYRVRALPRGREVAAPPAPLREPAPRPVPVSMADDPPRAITAYLRMRFDGVQRRDDPAVLLYVEAPLVAVEDATLRRVLPDTHFFVTRVVACDHLDPFPVVVSYTRAAGSDDVRAIQVVEFVRSSRRFLSQFLGIRAPTTEERGALTLAIAQLFARTMADGHAHSSTVDFVETEDAEFWFGDERREIIMLFVGAHGRIRGIEVLDVPKGRALKLSSR